MTAPAAAADVTVTKLADTNDGMCTLADCSLREAVTAPGGPHDITFASGLTGTITLSGTPLYAGPGTNFYGPGAGVLSVSGGNTIPVMVTAGLPADPPVKISGLTLTAGNTLTYGGGLSNGGAIQNLAGKVEIEDSVISNSTSGNLGGGGIWNQDGGSVTIVDSAITGNYAISTDSGQNTIGGGIANYNATATITGSTISGNTVKNVYDFQSAYGGGVASYGSPSTLTITNSTITGNEAEDNVFAAGGGIGLQGGTDRLRLESSTVSGNSATVDNAVGGYGGGIFNNSLLEPVLMNSIVANNTIDGPASSGPDMANPSGETQADFTLFENATGLVLDQSVPGSVLTGVDPLLGGLLFNGGPTRTLKPATTSPVIDRGGTTGTPQTTDQRGLLRPFDVPSLANFALGDASDMGAVELQSSDFPPPPGGSNPAPPPAKKCRKGQKLKKGKCVKKKRKKR